MCCKDTIEFLKMQSRKKIVNHIQDRVYQFLMICRDITMPLIVFGNIFMTIPCLKPNGATLSPNHLFFNSILHIF